MPRKSSIKQLPPPIKTEIDRLLSDGRTTIDEIVAHLQKLGVTVSRSAVGRYSQRFEDVSRKMREAREISTAFAKELGDFKNDEVGRVVAVRNGSVVDYEIDEALSMKRVFDLDMYKTACRLSI